MAAKVALIGGSGMSVYHADGILDAEGLELAGICDVLPAARQKAEDKYGVPTWDTIEACLASPDVDVVVVILPNDLHLPVTLQAIAAGKHVVVEKPMGMNYGECEQMIAAAKAAGKLLTVHQNRRWDNDFLAIKQAVDAGRVGQVLEVEVSNEGHWIPGGWRHNKAQAGGVLYDWGAHQMDQMLRLRPEVQPVRVFAEIYTDPAAGTDIELAGRVFIHMDDGSRLVYNFSHVSHHSPRPRWYVSGLEGALELKALGEDVTLYKVVHKGMEVCTFPSMVIDAEPQNWHNFYFNLSAALAGKEELAIQPEESALVVKIIDAALQSAKEGKVVNL